MSERSSTFLGRVQEGMRVLELADGRLIGIRTAVPDDAAVLLAYLRKVGGESDNLTFGPEGPGLSEAEEHEYLAHAASSNNSLVLIALHEQSIVGSLSFDGGRRARTRHTGELGISVTQSFAGNGIGRALLELLIEWAEQSGVIRKLNLRTRVDNTDAVRLYERLGWVVEGRVTRDQGIGDVYTDTLFMGRPVDRR
jgi:RimJ/RimL family protein N-acetyltransferase